MNESTPVGKTRNQGWEIGVRRTFPVTPERAWEVLTSQPGLGFWLGTGISLPFKKGDHLTTAEGTIGEIRSYAEGRLIRLRWQPPEWDFASTLQLRVLAASTGSTISVHHEHLQNGDQREQMRQRWAAMLDRLGELLDLPAQP